MAKKYTLLPIPLKQGFANGGIKQRVPYQLPATDDDLNWLEGFTDAYQRPVIPENLGEKGGRYVRMGQINQILENISQAFLDVKQSLNNVSETIDKGILIKVDKVITNANNSLTNRKVVWLQTSGNQNAAGLKNFQGININNYRTKGNAVASLEWCNGMPIKTLYRAEPFRVNTNYTITNKNIMTTFYTNTQRNDYVAATHINNMVFSIEWGGFSDDRWQIQGDKSFIFASVRDVLINKFNDYCYVVGEGLIQLGY